MTRSSASGNSILSPPFKRCLQRRSGVSSEANRLHWNPPTVCPLISKLDNQKIQRPLALAPCRHSHVSELPASPRLPMVPPRRFCTSSRFVRSRMICMLPTRSTEIISLGTVGLGRLFGQSIDGGAHITRLSAGVLRIGCAQPTDDAINIPPAVLAIQVISHHRSYCSVFSIDSYAGFFA